jgi:hypothetical protein
MVKVWIKSNLLKVIKMPSQKKAWLMRPSGLIKRGRKQVLLGEATLIKLENVS